MANGAPAPAHHDEKALGLLAVGALAAAAGGVYLLTRHRTAAGPGGSGSGTGLATCPFPNGNLLVGVIDAPGGQGGGIFVVNGPSCIKRHVLTPEIQTQTCKYPSATQAIMGYNLSQKLATGADIAGAPCPPLLPTPPRSIVPGYDLSIL